MIEIIAYNGQTDYFQQPYYNTFAANIHTLHRNLHLLVLPGEPHRFLVCNSKNVKGTEIIFDTSGCKKAGCCLFSHLLQAVEEMNM